VDHRIACPAHLKKGWDRLVAKQRSEASPMAGLDSQRASAQSVGAEHVAKGAHCSEQLREGEN
jgi:hypothetical protein